MKRMLNQNLIDFLNSLDDLLKYNSSTNTVEVVKNLSVAGTILTTYNTEAFIIVDENNSSLTFSYEQGNALVIKNENQSGIYFDVFDDSGELYQGATSKNLKTIFGKSILKNTNDTGNIDLYKHYLTIGVKDEASSITDTFSILVQSSSNVDCSSATGETQKLKTLLKASGSSIKTYEYGPNIDFSSMGMLLWTGSILCITASGGELNIVNIVDRVETL